MVGVIRHFMPHPSRGSGPPIRAFANASRCRRLCRMGTRGSDGGGWNWPDQTKNSVKVYLTDHQGLRLLCIGGRCNLVTVREAYSLENAMRNETLTVRIAQALFAVGVTTASVLVFQFAMLVG